MRRLASLDEAPVESLGRGKIDFPKVIGAIAETGFSGWAQLETVAPSGDVSKDMKTNLEYARGLLARA